MMKIKTIDDVRFYLYVSDTKLNMLFEQLFSIKNRANHIGVSVNTGFVSASLKSESESSIDRDDKLRAVEEELINRKLVGTPEEPYTYFKGILPMRWGLYDDGNGRPLETPPLVYFSGFDETAPLIVGLGGSSSHVTGFDGATSTHSRSATPSLVNWLLDGLSTNDPFQEPRNVGLSHRDGMLFEAMAIALHYLRPPTQQLEFLAKTLTTGELLGYKHMTGLSDAKVILGTPIYVQLTHPIPEPVTYGLDENWADCLS